MIVCCKRPISPVPERLNLIKESSGTGLSQNLFKVNMRRYRSTPNENTFFEFSKIRRTSSFYVVVVQETASNV